VVQIIDQTVCRPPAQIIGSRTLSSGSTLLVPRTYGSCVSAVRHSCQPSVRPRQTNPFVAMHRFFTPVALVWVPSRPCSETQVSTSTCCYCCSVGRVTSAWIIREEISFIVLRPSPMSRIYNVYDNDASTQNNTHCTARCLHITN